MLSESLRQKCAEELPKIDESIKRLISKYSQKFLKDEEKDRIIFYLYHKQNLEKILQDGICRLEGLDENGKPVVSL
jgi:hypothetical protein